jgi:hypothetical protein
VTRRILPGKWMRRATLRTGLLVQLVWRPSKRCARIKSKLGQFRIQLRASGVTVPRLLDPSEDLGHPQGHRLVDFARPDAVAEQSASVSIVCSGAAVVSRWSRRPLTVQTVSHQHSSIQTTPSELSAT